MLLLVGLAEKSTVIGPSGGRGLTILQKATLTVPLVLPNPRKMSMPHFQGKNLVAQGSATGVTVAATPLCSAICFRNPKVPRCPPPAPGPLLAANETGKCDGGVQRKVRHLDFGGCSAILVRHL